MPRNLVVCCDGTNNEFGIENTNVARLVQVLERDPVLPDLPAEGAPAEPRSKQLLYYDPGVGTLPEPGVLSRLSTKISNMLGLAFGAGLNRNVEEAYSFLMDFWEPGDRVYLFGFSRGAYTVRVLAGLLHALGLLPRGNQNLVPYVLRLFSAIRGRSPDGSSGTSWYWRLCHEFRWTFARPVRPDDDSRRFPVHFLGVWDTVSSVGWVLDPAKFPYTARNPSVTVIRHAVALDERRWFFRQNLMEKAADRQDLLELWFPGVHADVGGGYPEREGGLWRLALEWMLDEAAKHGLLINAERRQRVLHRSEASEEPWTDPAHESLTWKWWPAEFFPKLRRVPGSKWRWPRLGLGRHRTVPASALLHRTTLLRIREADYAPTNLAASFLKKIRDLPEPPETMPYQP